MGAIIGHEIGHSFDNRGARYDAEGRLDSGWSAEDSDPFRALGDALVRQYDACHLFLNVTKALMVHGLTGDQQFFVNGVQTWRSWQSATSRRYLLVNDPHSPDEYRADIVRNLDAWYLAFGVEPGQKLYLAPKDRIKVWWEAWKMARPRMRPDRGTPPPDSGTPEVQQTSITAIAATQRELERIMQ